MARKVFFSFEYSDVTRAMVVRNSAITKDEEARGFIDKAEFEKIEKQGKQAIKNWIDAQLSGTTVTVILVGANTCSSEWVQYEIDESIKRGNGLLGINISGIKNLLGFTTTCCGKIPAGYPFYAWVKDVGYNNLGTWVEAAAKAAGK